VAKAGGKHRPNERVSPEEALSLPNMPPGEAADAITQAIHRYKCRIYCNGAVVGTRMLQDIAVVAVQESDGRWTAVVESVSNSWPGNIFRWELVRAEVEALRKAEPLSAASWAPLEFEDNPRRPNERVGEYVERVWQRLLADPGVKNVSKKTLWNLYNEWSAEARNG
jgi:hypothetical protein